MAALVSEADSKMMRFEMKELYRASGPFVEGHFTHVTLEPVLNNSWENLDPKCKVFALILGFLQDTWDKDLLRFEVPFKELSYKFLVSNATSHLLLYPCFAALLSAPLTARLIVLQTLVLALGYNEKTYPQVGVKNFPWQDSGLRTARGAVTVRGPARTRWESLSKLGLPEEDKTLFVQLVSALGGDAHRSLWWLNDKDLDEDEDEGDGKAAVTRVKDRPGLRESLAYHPCEGKASCWLLAVLVSFEGALDDPFTPSPRDRLLDYHIRELLYHEVTCDSLAAWDDGDGNGHVGARWTVADVDGRARLMENLHLLPAEGARTKRGQGLGFVRGQGADGWRWCPADGWAGTAVFAYLARCVLPAQTSLS